MANVGQPLSSTLLLTAPIVDQNGKLTPVAALYFQNLQTIFNRSFNQQGQLVAGVSTTTPVSGRGGTLGSILAHLTDAGLFSNADSIIDGSTHQLAGGAAAYLALVASLPTAGQVLEWNGTAWVPVTLAGPTIPTTLNGLGPGALALVAGTNITLTLNTPSAGDITIDAAGGGTAYLKGTVSVPTGATSGTFKATGTVTGATTAMAAVASCPTLIGLCGTSPVNWACDVVSANTVEVQVTLPNIGPTWGTLSFNVVVFP